MYDGLTPTHPEIPPATINFEPKWYAGEGGMEGHSDGGLGGTSTQSKKDLVVGLGVVGTILSCGTLAEGGASLATVFSMLNALDDAFGAFTEGTGSFTQDLTPDEYMQLVSSAKLIMSVYSSTRGGKELLNKQKTKNAYSVFSFISDLASTANSVYSDSNENREENEN